MEQLLLVAFCLFIGIMATAVTPRPAKKLVRVRDDARRDITSRNLL